MNVQDEVIRDLVEALQHARGLIINVLICEGFYASDEDIDLIDAAIAKATGAKP